MIGRVIGTYRIESLLGKGGMGTVYRGLDLMLDRPVAVKALRADVAASPQHVERFRQEARTLARLLDPHIATLYALHRDGDDLYMVMEFVEGETFEALLHREGRLPVGRALALFDQALQGLEHAHRRGIVHRDVKPANFMLTPGGTVKAMDFGIARLLGSTRMTQTRHAIGTAEYMAPEQVRAREVDARTDVYALGVMLYEMVTGRVPFEAESAFETMQAHLQAAPPSPRHLVPGLPEAVEAALLTALAKDPADRHPSVAAFRAALADVALDAPLADPIPTPSEPEAAEPSGQRQPQRPPKATVAAPAPRAREGPEPGDRGKDATEPASTSLSAVADSTSEISSETPTSPPETTIAPSQETEVDAPESVDALRSGDDRRPSPTVLAVPEGGTPGPAPRVVPPTRIAPAGMTAPVPTPGGDWSPQPTLRDRVAALPRPALAAAAGVLLAAAAWAVWPNGGADPLTAEPIAEARGEGSVSALEPVPRALQPVPARPDGPAIGSPETAGPGETIAPADAASSAERPPPETSRSPSPAELPRRVEERRATERQEPAPPEHIESRPAPAEPAAPRTGTARVLVRPFGDVYIDGRRLARGTNAPVTADLAPGTYTVRATHPEFGELTETVRVRAGETADVRLQFATPAEVTVVSDPNNAEILLDGRPTGRYTPAVVTVPPGRHTIGVERDGFAPASQTVTVEAGRAPSRITLTLSPLQTP
ncbi:serine/threonine-protein kinase [Rubrivirga marina]|uniref:non-specific serine/threonine protein kinase n=1 Tax=Rubrivirga marina TaxID=1196024 RepID=A0A271J0P4_9BACT|nr:serine/threonine-protein kinase [Rubrivirga marina]PAP76525.1 hypothetical protein BSZ37_08765 [Rubrivirga marina]